MGDYVIRQAVAADVSALVRGRVRMFEDMAAYRGQVLDPTLAATIGRESAKAFEAGFGTEHFGWIAELDGLPLATAMVTLQPWLPHPRYPTGTRPYYHSVWTDPAHRGHGLARRLTESAIEWARQRGHLTFVLHASEMGAPIYERLGFTQSNEWTLELDPQSVSRR